MRCFMMWHGGASYAVPELDDIEEFASLDALKQAFDHRADSSATFYPCVERSPEEDGGQSAWVYFYDPREVSDPYPDRVLHYGARGGLRLEYA